MTALDQPSSAQARVSLEEFLVAVRPGLTRVLNHYAIPPEESQDVLQQALLALVFRWHSIHDPERWLTATLRNHCRAYWRRRRYRLYEAVDATVLEVLARPQSPPQEGRELWSDFESLLDELPERCRKVLKLRYELGLKPAEIARRLGYTLAGVRKTTHRCLAALSRKVLGSRLPPPRR
jgi:RNA polymerase sigma factor (sigma-70 family)